MALVQAVVVVKNLTTGATQRVITGKNGAYRISGLGPGEYSLEAAVPKLGRGRVEGIVIAAGHATRVQAALVMELPEADLPLEATVHELDPLEPAVTTLISSEEVAQLPLVTRNWQAIAATTPAAGPSPRAQGNFDEDGGQYPSPSGGRTAVRETGETGSFDDLGGSVDQMPAGLAFHAPGGQRGQAGAGESAVISMEARMAGSTAESGRAGGGFNRTTAHGGNPLHGQFVYRNRQSLWGAQNPFTQWIQEATPATATTIGQFTAEPYTSPNSRQTFGFGAGSRILRDKLFWFAAVDGEIANDPSLATVRHPDEFFQQPTNDELAVLGARLGVAAPDYYEEEVAAYNATLEGMAGLLGPVPRSSNSWEGFARIDWQATDRNHISLEASGATNDSPGGGLTRASETYGSHSFGNSKSNSVWLLARAESFFSPTLLNSADVQVRRVIESDTPQTPSAFEAPLLANEFGQLPEIIADSKYGFILGKPARLGGRKYPEEQGLFADETLSWVHGAHLVRAGVSFDHISDATDTLVNGTGTYSYADVLNFASDAASFEKYGFNGVDNPFTDQHNCDVTGRVHRSGDTLLGLGYTPCYAWYSQSIGPSNWQLSTNDMAAFVTEQWQPMHQLTISAGVRVEAQQLPPAIAAVANPDLAATEKLPSLGWNFAPRVGLAFAPWNRTVIRVGGGMYFGRIDNAVVLAALTQTGSPYADLNFFFRADDPGAPPFPYVFPTQPVTAVTPGAVEFGQHFRVPQVDQAVASIEQELPRHWVISASALVSLGRRLPISIDTNLAAPVTTAGTPQTITYAVVDALAAGPIKAAQLTVPFYTERTDLNYQQLATIESRANSTYDAAMLKVARNGAHGLNLRAHYLYAHATDWNPNESAQVAANDVLDPGDFGLEYGTSNLDIRHTAAGTVIYEPPLRLRGWMGNFTNGWSVGAVGQFRSGLPYTMRTAGYVPAYFGQGGGEGVGPGINGSAGDNRIYGMGSDGNSYNIGRNTYRYPSTYTADARLGKRFLLAHNRDLQLLAESFNLFNHQNVTRIETIGYYIDRGSKEGGLPTLNFLTGLTPNTVEFGKPLDVNATNFFRQREIELGIRARF